MTKKSRDRRVARRWEATADKVRRDNPRYVAFNSLSIDEIKAKFGVSINLDKLLDKYKGVDLFPNQTEKARDIISKVTNPQFANQETRR